MTRVSLVALAAALLIPVAAAQAASAPVALDPVTRTLTAATTSPACAKTVATTYTAPIAGFLSTALTAAGGDWDLGLRDARSGAGRGSSRAFGSDELVQTWVSAGDRIAVLGCRRSGSTRSATVTMTLVDVAQPPRATSSLVRVFAGQKQLAGLEALGFDVTENQRPGRADVITSGLPQLGVLQSMGLRTDTVIKDLGAAELRDRRADTRYRTAVGGRSGLPSGRTTYRTYPEIQEELKKLVADHPGEVRPVTIGKTFQGRDITGLEIAKDVKADDGRPVHFVMGVHHAREWAAGEAAMEYAHLLAESPGDARIQGLLANERTLIVPIVNVDGYISSRDSAPIDPSDQIRDNLNGGEEVDPLATGLPLSTVESIVPPGGVLTYRRKNCDGEFPNPMVPCYLQYGIDNNRNYGTLWGGPGSNSDFGSQAYHGPAPRSEPETRAVFNYVRTHQVTMLITLHNVAALVLRPPGLRSVGFAPDEPRLKAIGDAMGAATKYESEYGFQLYDTAGTTEDDTYEATGGYGYTIEIGPKDGAFHQPYKVGFVDQWDGTYADKNGKGLREALLISGDAAANTADHAVLRGKAPAGVTLRLAKKFDTKTSEYCDGGVGVPLNVPAAAPLIDALACPAGKQKPITLKDELNSTTVVPSSGAFAWHVDPSTRPFVGGGAVHETAGEEVGKRQTFKGKSGAVGDVQSFTFDLPAAELAAKVRLTADLPEDYDIEVFRREADGKFKSVGTSGESPGSDEEVVLEKPGGKYRADVKFFTAATGGYTLTVSQFAKTTTVDAGAKEAYVLTCEEGGKVLESHSVVIDRSTAIDLALGCGRAPSTSRGPGKTTVALPGGDASTPVLAGQSTAVDGKPVKNSASPGAIVKPQARKPRSAAAKARAKARARVKAKARCLSRAKKVKRSEKRRAAMRRCR